MTESVPALPAATMLVLDDRPDLHVVLGRRRASSEFVGGMIVFPGGGVDAEDGDDVARRLVPVADVPGMAAEQAAPFLHAALRETVEEVGLWLGGSGPVDPDDFPHVGHWITPEGSPRRYDTHFFLARYRGGELVADNEELDEAWWERPADTLRRIDAGDLAAILPTIDMLESLAAFDTVGAAFAATGQGGGRRHQNGWTSF